MLKPLPQEGKEGKEGKAGNESTHNVGSTRSSMRGPILRSIKNTGKKKKHSKKQQPTLQIEIQIQNLQTTDGPLLAKASQQLMDFIKKAHNITLNELNELIHNLQRTVLSLQKKRIQSVRRHLQKQLRKKKM